MTNKPSLLDIGSTKDWPPLTQGPDLETLPAVSLHEPADLRPLKEETRALCGPALTAPPAPLGLCVPRIKTFHHAANYRPAQPFFSELSGTTWAANTPNQPVWLASKFRAGKLDFEWRLTMRKLVAHTLPPLVNMVLQNDELDGQYERVTQMVADLEVEDEKDGEDEDKDESEDNAASTDEESTGDIGIRAPTNTNKLKSDTRNKTRRGTRAGRNIKTRRDRAKVLFEHTQKWQQRRSRRGKLSGAANEFRPGHKYHVSGSQTEDARAGEVDHTGPQPPTAPAAMLANAVRQKGRV